MNDIEVSSSPAETSGVNKNASVSIGVHEPVDIRPFRSSLRRTLRIVLVTILAIQTIVLGFLYVPIPPNPDHEIYDYMAWSALAKGGLYRNGGDMNMPGEALLHIVSMKLFGNHFWSYRLLDYNLLIGFTGLVGLLSVRYFGKTFAGLFFGLYPIVYTTSGYWMTGQRDLLATHGIILAGFTYLRRIEGGRLLWLILSGLLMAIAVLLKPTFLAFGPILLVVVAIFVRRGIKSLVFDTATLVAVGAAFLGSVFVLGWMTDSLKAWYEMTFVYSLQNYVGGTKPLTILNGMLETSLKSWHWYMVMAFVGLIYLMIEPRNAPLAVIVSVVSTLLVSTFVQRKGFGYHYGGLLAVISLLGAFYLSQIFQLARRITEPQLRFLVLAFPFFLVGGGLASKYYTQFKPQVRWYLDSSQFASMLKSCWFDDVYEASIYVRSATKPGDTVWTYSVHSMINSLADRAFPTRLVTPVLLRANKDTALALEWRGEVESIFRDHPPEFIVLEFSKSSNPNEFVGLDKIMPFEPASAFKEGLDHFYFQDRQIGNFVFFRKDQAKHAEYLRRNQEAGRKTTSHQPE